MFKFNYKPNRLSQMSTPMGDASSGHYLSANQLTVPKTLSLTPKVTPTLVSTLTPTLVPTLRRSVSEKAIDSPTLTKHLSQKSNELTVESTVDEIRNDSKALKDRVAEELEKIETWKELTQMEANRRTEEIKELKAKLEEMSNKLIVSETEKSRLVSRMKSDRSEREDVLTRMETTRQMFTRLRDYIQTLENRIQSFSGIRDTQEMVNQSRTELYDDMCQRFQRLDFNQRTHVSDLMTQLDEKDSALTHMKQELEQIIQEFDCTRSETNNQIQSLVEELNQMRQQIETLEADLTAERERIIQMTAESNEKEELLHKTREESLEVVKSLTEELDSKETAVKEIQIEKQNSEKMVEEMAEQIADMKITEGNKDQQIADLENKLKSNEEEMNLKIKDMETEANSLVTEKSRLSELNEELNKTLISLANEKQEFVDTSEVEKNSMISDYENKIEELESKANQSMIEKESIEKRLKDELKELKTDFDYKMNEFSTKITNLETKVHELNALKDQNETKIGEMLSEAELLRVEKQNLEMKLDRKEESFKFEISNMSTILSTCKSDYTSRIEDKEDRIKEYKRELERTRLSVDHLSKKCDRLEGEKQSISRHLQQLTISSMAPMHSSPNRVLTPKFMSPIETSRISVNRNTSSLDHSLNASLQQVLNQSDNEDGILSAKQELKEKMKAKSQEFNANLNQKAIKENPKPPKQTKKSVKHWDSDSVESVYEILDNKLKKVKKPEKGPKNSNKEKTRRVTEHRLDSPVRVDMSLAEEKAVESLTDEYDIEKVVKADAEPKEPLQKKMKTGLELKTYAKKNIRAENIVKGRPTPTKGGDLSWLNF